MKLLEANQALKLECALRELGFVEIDWMVYAHAGIYFVHPVSYHLEPTKNDDLLGYQVDTDCQPGIRLGSRILRSAKLAIEYATENYYA